MKLFTVGPVEMYDKTLEERGRQLPYFRTNEFSDIMFDIEDMFLKLVNAPDKSRLVPLTASGTGAMECAIINTLTKEDKVLVIDGGSFGHRFVKMCETHNLNTTVIEVKFGDTLTKEMIYEYDNKGYTALLVNIDETSIGQLYDIDMLGEFVKKNNMVFIVDAISSFLADPIDMTNNNINIFITSSQKALALAPGMSFIIIDNKTICERINKIDCKCMYFDIKDYLLNMERGQTPFTPAVGIILELRQRLKDIMEAGIDNTVAQHKKRAEYFRELCSKNNIKVCEYPKSNAVTPIYFPKKNAYAVFTKMKDKYNIMLTPSGGDTKDLLLRVGHLGDLKLSDYDEVVKYIVECENDEKLI